MTAQRMIALVEAEPARTTEVGLALPVDLSVEDWRGIGQQLSRMDRAYRWWIGDWLNYGERAYGDAYTEALETSGLEYQTLRIQKYVAGRIELFRRRNNLSWSHHLEVAALTPEEQDEWLDRAEEQHWTRRELRAWLKARNAKRLPTHMPLLRFCQDLPTPIIVAQILRVYFPDASSVFDMTGGDGGFWDGSELVKVTRLIVDPSQPANGHDFRDLGHVVDASHDVAMFDPPHVADAGDESIMGARFGTYDDVDLESAIRAGCREAWRIARLGAVIKVTDHVHGQHYVLESDWVRDAIGQAPFDAVYQVRPSAVIDPKWHDQASAYNNGSTYLIFRKGNQEHRRR